MEEIKNLFLKKENKAIVAQFTTGQVIKSLGFEDSLRLAYRLLYNSDWDSGLQEYAISLICENKNIYLQEWEKDWRLEAFLGSAYDVVMGDDSNYHEKYNSFLRAYQKANPPPPELMIELARCIDAPGEPPVSCDEAIALAKKSMEIEPYADAAGILCAAYFGKDMEEESRYWAKIRDGLNRQGKKSPPLEPPFVREGYK